MAAAGTQIFALLRGGRRVGSLGGFHRLVPFILVTVCPGGIRALSPLEELLGKLWAVRSLVLLK